MKRSHWKLEDRDKIWQGKAGTWAGARAVLFRLKPGSQEWEEQLWGAEDGPEGAGGLGGRMGLQPRRRRRRLGTRISAGSWGPGQGREKRHWRVNGPKEGERPYMASWEDQNAWGTCPCPSRTVYSLNTCQSVSNKKIQCVVRVLLKITLAIFLSKVLFCGKRYFTKPHCLEPPSTCAPLHKSGSPVQLPPRMPRTFAQSLHG